MSKHTKGPWRIGRTVMGEPAITSDHKPDGAHGACMVRVNYIGSRKRGDRDEAEYNAERIVACVNACEGIPNPQDLRSILSVALELAEGSMNDPDKRSAAEDLVTMIERAMESKRRIIA
jgi:hypothetical protein